MAIAIDASSPAVVTSASTAASTVVTASFTPPANSVLAAVCVGDWDTNYSGTPHITFSDSQSGSWTQINNVNTSGGSVLVTSGYRVVSSSVAMTVTGTYPDSLTKTRLIYVAVLTGAATSGTIASSLAAVYSTSAGATQQTVTTTTSGSWILLGAGDDTNQTLTANGNTTQTGTINDASVASVAKSGHSASNTGTPGSISFGWTGSTAIGQGLTVSEFMPVAASTSLPPSVFVPQAVTLSNTW